MARRTDRETAWHHLGSRADLLARVPYSLAIDGQRIAVFAYDGRLHAISDRCNHKGGPLSEGMLRGEFVTCPWHAWEYSVVTGRGPAGFDEEQVATYDIDERSDGEVYVATPARSPRRLKKHKPSRLLEEHPKPPGAAPRVLGLSTTAMDDTNARFSTSDHLLDLALAHAADGLGCDTKMLRLRDLSFRECEGNYSKHARACTWPCAITERDPTDELVAVYEGLVQWADIVVVSTPIRWGSASSLYFKMAERMNCIQNQITTANRVLIEHKVASFIITGGQDNVQAVAGSLLGFWAELGFAFPPFPYIAHTRGWDAEDMQTNVRLVRRSTRLEAAAHELVERAVAFWQMLDTGRGALGSTTEMQRAGRKAGGVGEG